MKDKLSQIPIRIGLLYAIIAGLYILVSDRLLEVLISDPEMVHRVHMYKDYAFVVITSLIIYLDLLHQIRSLKKEKSKAIQVHQALQQSESNYRNMANYSAFAKFVNLNGEIVYANQACAKLLGYSSPDELIGKDPLMFFHPSDHQIILERIDSLKQIGQSVKPNEEKIIRQDGSVLDVEVSSSLFPYENQNAIYVILRDITEFITARNEVKRQLSQLQALREIDQKILNSLDLHSIMEVCLTHTQRLLEIDAAKLYLNDADTGEGTLLIAFGFMNDSNFPYNKRRYQHIISMKDTVFTIDLQESEELFINPDLYKEEKFVSYCGIPLISKGEVKGILEIYNRRRIEHSEECLYLVGTLSNQMAIAIDNIQLYQGLRKSLDDLSEAYDATIEGWSRALDLRDEETEGHTQRVTENTIRLARKMGIQEKELTHVRRGALLHDIGKLGIPDRILLKKGKLSTQEWTIMRQHPNFAFQMLRPISYLRPALDIPYCHHEKWDGTGYPRRLKGEEIPLSARIFAVIDVWDALRSDRPYRPKWPEDKVLEHIRSLSGTHFDPEVVEAFFEVYNELVREV